MGQFLTKILPVCFALVSVEGCGQESPSCTAYGDTCYYGVEINGMLCGYAVETRCRGQAGGRDLLFENSAVTLKMTLLGAAIDISIISSFGTDAATGKPALIDLIYDTGKSKVHSRTVIRGDTAFYESESSGIRKKVALVEDVIVSSQSRYPYLVKVFDDGGSTTARFRLYEPMMGEIVERVFSKINEEEATLADSLFHTIMIEETDIASGVKTMLWISRDDGYNVRALVAGRNIYLADKSVIGRIRMVDMNEVMFARVNKVIPGFQGMEWLKVSVAINTYGDTVKAENLSFPGQKFTGSVSGSFVEGVFEIEPPLYDGSGAPPFPADYASVPELLRYLSPELMIESDDPLVRAEAEMITAGAADSWVAALRLSRWVSENIMGALPGGGSALNTLKMREAECGGHSRLLTAFCRSVGIPARLATGCMYVPYYNGSFGQHAWTEIYMGDAGWIPVDATIHETDHINAGHIRLGEKATFQPQHMEILDYRVKQ